MSSLDISYVPQDPASVVVPIEQDFTAVASNLINATNVAVTFNDQGVAIVQAPEKVANVVNPGGQ